MTIAGFPIGLVCAALSALALAACQREAPADTSSAATPTQTASGAITGVVPHAGDSAPAASDRPVAIGGVEAGQAAGGATKGTPAAPTGGDGAASAPK